MARRLHSASVSCYAASRSFSRLTGLFNLSLIHCTASQAQRWCRTRPPASPFISQPSLMPALMTPSPPRQTGGESEVDPQSDPQKTAKLRHPLSISFVLPIITNPAHAAVLARLCYVTTHISAPDSRFAPRLHAATSQARCAWLRPGQAEPLWHGQMGKSDLQTWREWVVLKGRPLCQRCWQGFLTFWNPPTSGAAAGEPGLAPCCEDPESGGVRSRSHSRSCKPLGCRDADASVYEHRELVFITANLLQVAPLGGRDADASVYEHRELVFITANLLQVAYH